MIKKKSEHKKYDKLSRASYIKTE